MVFDIEYRGCSGLCGYCDDFSEVGALVSLKARFICGGGMSVAKLYEMRCKWEVTSKISD